MLVVIVVVVVVLIMSVFVFVRPRSFKSRLRNALLNQDQYVSIGFKSGDRGGICQSVTRLFRWARFTRGLVRKDSLSHRTVHGPLRHFGFKSKIARLNPPDETVSTHSLALPMAPNND